MNTAETPTAREQRAAPRRDELELYRGPLGDVAAARKRARDRKRAHDVDRPALDRFARANYAESAAVRALLDDYAIASAEAAAYRELYACVAGALAIAQAAADALQVRPVVRDQGCPAPHPLNESPS